MVRLATICWNPFFSSAIMSKISWYVFTMRSFTPTLNTQFLKVKNPAFLLSSMESPLNPTQWSSHPVAGSGANVCYSPGKSMNMVPASILVFEHDALSKYPDPRVIYTSWYSFRTRRLFSGKLYPSGCDESGYVSPGRTCWKPAVVTISPHTLSRGDA